MPNQILFVKSIVNGLLILNIDSSTFAHSQNTVSFLGIEKVGLFINAAKDKIEFIMVFFVVISKENLVQNHEASIAASFHITLIELATILTI